MQKLYNILSVAAIALLLITLLKNCSNVEINDPKDFKGITEVSRTIDTIVNHTYDTIWQYEKIYLPSDTIVLIDSFLIQDTTVYGYAGAQRDEQINVSYELNTTGELQDIALSYELLEPITTVEYVDRRIYEEVTLNKYQTGFYVGGGLDYIGELNRLDFNISAALTLKKGYYLGYRFAPITKSHGLQFKYRLLNF